MALTRQKKEETVTEVATILANSKMTVFAHYQGTPVKAMQQLRAGAQENGTQIRVIKNRLFKKAIASVDDLKDIDTSDLKGQLLYAFNQSDEVAPAQDLAAFGRSNSQIQFVGAINRQGQLLSAEEVKLLSELPSKDQLQAQLVAAISSPISSMAGVMAAKTRSIMNVLSARAESLAS